MGIEFLTMANKATAHILRRMGARFEGFGLGMQGELAFTETMGTHRAVSAYQGTVPIIGADSFVAPSSSVIGSVNVGAGSSVWYGAALRGDVNSITVGSNSHIGDRTVVHVASEAGSVKGKALNTSIGDGVSIGPLSVIHACTVANATAEDVAATAAQLEDAATLSRVHHAECSKSWSQVHDEKIDVHEGQFKDPDYTSDWKGEWRA